jgi:hypothetical protein
VYIEDRQVKGVMRMRTTSDDDNGALFTTTKFANRLAAAIACVLALPVAAHATLVPPGLIYSVVAECHRTLSGGRRERASSMDMSVRMIPIRQSASTKSTSLPLST